MNIRRQPSSRLLRSLPAIVVLLVLGGAGGLLAAGLPGTAVRAAALTPTDTTGRAVGCLYPDGSRAACPQPPPWLLQASDLGYDIDNQPRPFAYLGKTWVPVVPAGCNESPLKDAGADEFYAAGCEPLVWTWFNAANRTERLLPDGTISSSGTTTATTTQPTTTATTATTTATTTTATTTAPTTTASTTTTPPSTLPSTVVSIFSNNYLLNLAASTPYQKWRQTNSGEALTYDAYLDHVQRGVAVTPPSLATCAGRAFVAAVESYADAKNAPSASLAAEVISIFTGSYQPSLSCSTLYAKWRRDNPADAARADNYLANGGTQPTMTTAFGRAYVAETSIYWAAKTS